MVYIVQSGGINGLIKIGTSRHAHRRIKFLRRAEGQTLWLLGVMDGHHKEEHALHKRFAHLRYGGEWFFPGRDLLDFIMTLPCPSEFVSKDGSGWAYRLHAAFAETNS